jgi:short-subunit dehydrogenase
MSKSRIFTPKPIDQQTIVITGASSGIGLATAKLAAQKGARVVLASRNSEALNNCVDEINRDGGNALAVVADVSVWEDIVRLKDEAIKAFGFIDTWVNNAGTSIFGYLMDTDFSEERKLFETNFWGARMGCAAALEAMKEKGGVIINLGSEVSVASQPLLGMYSASKHALKAFTEAFRSELKDRNIPIAVTLIRPTAINTPFAEHGANRLPEGEPSLPAPQYPPELAAEAIIKCCEKPQRDVYVGGPAKLSAIMDTFFPSVKDLVAETRMKELKKGTRTNHHAMDENLHHPPSDEGKEEGSNEGMKAMNSLYTDASTLGLVRTLAHTAKQSLKMIRKAS